VGLSGADKLLIASIEGYKQMISKLHISIKGLSIAENLSNMAKTLSTLNYRLGKEQHDAVGTIMNINTDALLAIQSTRVTITKLENICKATVGVLNRKKDEKSLKIAIRVYLKASERVTPEVERAMECFTKVIQESAKCELS